MMGNDSNGGLKIAVYGAGAVGCYLGGLLAHAGAKVTLIGRTNVLSAIRTDGLTLTTYRPMRITVPSDRVVLATEPSAAKDADLILVTVKSAATPTVAEELATVAKPGAVILSFQNGIHNAEVLRKRLPEHIVLAGMVPYNVAQLGPGHWHQGTRGNGLHVDDHPALMPYLKLFEATGQPLRLSDDMNAVLWGKLLINLNNAVNALSGKPLKVQLCDWYYRRTVAACIEEGLGVLRRAKIEPAKVGAIAPRKMPWLLRMPDPIYFRLAKGVAQIDPKARSSMADDLNAGRKTEVDYLNGEIVRLAEQLGDDAPINRRIMALVHHAEAGGTRSWMGKDLLAIAKGKTPLPRTGA